MENDLILAYNYAGDTSSLIENYPSMSEALMQGTAVIDLFRIQQYVISIVFLVVLINSFFHHSDIDT